jgi:hypothetical protein
MTKKQPRVPETRTPNRAQRRGHEPAHEPLTRDRPMPPEPGTGARRHRKKTAENWNQ